MMKKYTSTDLALEARAVSSSPAISDEDYGIARVQTLTVSSDEESRLISKPVGRYVTISFGRLWNMPRDDIDELGDIVSREIQKLAEFAAPNASSLLVAGLGNRYMTADALGPLCVKQINVTRHLRQSEPKMFHALGVSEIAALVPGVVGQTGIETLELVRGAVETVKPDLLIVVDALASRSVDRLATTIQLTDSGIAPGSGIGSHRRAISRESTGVPTIAIGVPTVVNSSTLVYDALEKASITEISPELTEVLENGRSFFVSLKESDVAVEELSALLANAINGAFSVIL